MTSELLDGKTSPEYVELSETSSVDASGRGQGHLDTSRMKVTCCQRHCQGRLFTVALFISHVILLVLTVVVVCFTVAWPQSGNRCQQVAMETQTGKGSSRLMAMNNY